MVYWIEFILVLLPGLLLMLISTTPLVWGTIMAGRSLRKGNKGAYFRNLGGSIAAGALTLGLLFGSLFGTDLSSSSTAALIFVFAPIYAAAAFGIGYGLGALVYRRLTQAEDNTGGPIKISTYNRNLFWVPVALLGVLLFGIIKYSVQQNDLALAEWASYPETLYRLYAKVERGEADSFGIPLFLAQNRDTPADILEKLSRHDHSSVRILVVTNPSTDRSVVATLREDPSEAIRKAVQERLNRSLDSK